MSHTLAAPAAAVLLLQELRVKTVILATNQLQFVPMCDVVVVMKGGQLAEVGGYQDLMAKGGVLAALMKETTVSNNCNKLPLCRGLPVRSVPSISSTSGAPRCGKGC